MCDFAKDRFNLLSVDTEAKMEKELTMEYNRLLAKGSADEGATKEITRGQDYRNYSSYRAKKAEILVGKTFVHSLREKEIPNLFPLSSLKVIQEKNKTM